MQTVHGRDRTVVIMKIMKEMQVSCAYNHRHDGLSPPPSADPLLKETSPTLVLAKSGALTFKELFALEACDIASKDILFGRFAGETARATLLGPAMLLSDTLADS